MFPLLLFHDRTGPRLIYSARRMESPHKGKTGLRRIAGAARNVTGFERALLIASVLFVLVVELLNSAIEATVDRISFDDHRLAKRAKDIGSAAVSLSLVMASLVWALVILR